MGKNHHQNQVTSCVTVKISWKFHQSHPHNISSYIANQQMNRQMHASKNIFLVEVMILCSSSSRMKNKHETFTFIIYYFAHNLFFLLFTIPSLRLVFHLCVGSSPTSDNNNNNSRIYIAQNWYKSSNALESKKGESRDRHGSWMLNGT